MVKDQSHLSYLPSGCVGRAPGGGVTAVSECWTKGCTESVLRLGTVPPKPVSSSISGLPIPPLLSFPQWKAIQDSLWNLLYLCCASLSASHETHCLLQPIATVVGRLVTLSLPPCCRFQRFSLWCIVCCFCLQGLIFIWWIWLWSHEQCWTSRECGGRGGWSPCAIRRYRIAWVSVFGGTAWPS